MRGSWVGALCSWCHCPLESGGTLPLHGDAAQPPRLTPRMAEVATAHTPCFRTTPEKPARKSDRREKRRREHTTERQARRPSRGSWNVTPAAWKNSQGKVGLLGTLALLALWPLGSGTGSCLLFADTETSRRAFFELLVATHGVQTLERP